MFSINNELNISSYYITLWKLFEPLPLLGICSWFAASIKFCCLVNGPFSKIWLILVCKSGLLGSLYLLAFFHLEFGA